MSISLDRRTNQVLFALDEISEELVTMRKTIKNVVAANYEDGYQDGYNDRADELEEEKPE